MMVSHNIYFQVYVLAGVMTLLGVLIDHRLPQASFEEIRNRLASRDEPVVLTPRPERKPSLRSSIEVLVFACFVAFMVDIILSGFVDVGWAFVIGPASILLYLAFTWSMDRLKVEVDCHRLACVATDRHVIGAQAALDEVTVHLESARNTNQPTVLIEQALTGAASNLADAKFRALRQAEILERNYMGAALFVAVILWSVGGALTYLPHSKANQSGPPNVTTTPQATPDKTSVNHHG